ncbi:hypothetical protein ZOSMA_69G00870 [Zostera marina]|uniref:Uncharacterized protein n=1 Tax=Zostera marina TaxID=29655 RepID=A0A0K9NRH9_ZOSMR|nr:hypothetical protein ZOSMA_69G00870 [Zostera marina]
MAHPPWDRWETSWRIEHYSPLSTNVIYMPATATNGKISLDRTSLLAKVIGGQTEEAAIAAFIKSNWRPRGVYRVTKVNQQSFKIGFHELQDFDRLRTKKWEFMNRDILLVRLWSNAETTVEDTLETVPQKATIHNIPEAFWGGDEAIGRIASALGRSLEDRTIEPSHQNPHLPPPLEVCVVIDRSFNYPPTLRIRLEGNEGVPGRDTLINIEYGQRTPYCTHCGGFGHWSQKCRGQRTGKWAQIISTAVAPVKEPAASFMANRNPANPAKLQNSKLRKLSTRRRRIPDQIAVVESGRSIGLCNISHPCLCTVNPSETNKYSRSPPPTTQRKMSQRTKTCRSTMMYFL